MENPATWGQAEQIIDHQLTETWDMITHGLVGLSTPRRIADALREAHLLIPEGDNAPGLRPPGLTDRDVARRLEFRVKQLMRLFEADAPDRVTNKQIDMILEASAWLRMEKRALAPGAEAEAEDWKEEN